MKIFVLLFFFSMHFAVAGIAKTYEYIIPHEDPDQDELIWEISSTEPFDELILTWNAPRTPDGRYSFFVSLQQDGVWSPWLYYADWGNCGQLLMGEILSFGQTNRGFARPMAGTCDGFRVHILAPAKEKLTRLKTVWASTSHLAKFRQEGFSKPDLESVLLEGVPRQSVNTLRLHRHWDMSMVAASLSAVRYLGKQTIEAAEFAEHVMDGDYESFDFWPLNAAESYSRLNETYRVHIERLPDFATLHSYLKKGFPVLVNIQGTPIGGIPWPPYRHHIVCVIGYDATTGKVICLDPAFPNDKSTYAAYLLDDFLRVWAKRQNIACLFHH